MFEHRRQFVFRRFALFHRFGNAGVIAVFRRLFAPLADGIEIVGFQIDDGRGLDVFDLLFVIVLRRNGGVDGITEGRRVGCRFLLRLVGIEDPESIRPFLFRRLLPFGFQFEVIHPDVQPRLLRFGLRHGVFHGIIPKFQPCLRLLFRLFDGRLSRKKRAHGKIQRQRQKDAFHRVRPRVAEKPRERIAYNGEERAACGRGENTRVPRGVSRGKIGAVPAARVSAQRYSIDQQHGERRAKGAEGELLPRFKEFFPRYEARAADIHRRDADERRIAEHAEHKGAHVISRGGKDRVPRDHAHEQQRGEQDQHHPREFFGKYGVLFFFFPFVHFFRFDPFLRAAGAGETYSFKLYQTSGEFTMLL